MEDTEQCLLLDLVRTYGLRQIKNKQESSALWDVLTETFNTSTGENYTKKQLQKRTAYASYKGKKHGQVNQVDIHEPIDFETQVKRAKKAKALADEICQSAEETQQKRLKIEHEHKLKLQEIEKLKKQQLKILL